MRAASLAKLHRAVDRHAAERVSIQPMQSGGLLAATASGDPAEVAVYITTTSEPARAFGGGAVTGHTVDVVGASHLAKFTTSSAPFTVAKGFVLTRLDRDGAPTYRVLGAYPFGIDRTILALAEIT